MRHYTENEHKLAAELSPDKVIAYLLAHDFEPTMQDVYVSLYRRPNDGLPDAVEVPLNPALADYGRRMHEALDAIGEPFLGLLHAIDPDRFPRERILALVGVTA